MILVDKETNEEYTYISTVVLSEGLYSGQYECYIYESMERFMAYDENGEIKQLNPYEVWVK